MLTRRRVLRGALPVAAVGVVAGGLGYRAIMAGREVAHAGDAIYVLSNTEAEVLALDPLTGALAHRIETETPPTRIAFGAGEGRVFAADPGPRTLWTLDGREGRVVAEEALDLEPSLLATSPEGTVLALLDWGEGLLELRDGGRTRLSGFEGAHDLRFSEDGARLFVSFIDRPEIWSVDIAGGAVGHRIGLEGTTGLDHMIRTIDGRLGLGVTPAGVSDSVFPIDLEAGEALAPLRVEAPIHRASTDAFGRYIFLPHLFDGVVEVMDVRQREIVARPVFDGPVTSLAPGFLGASMIAVSAESRSVVEMDLRDFSVISRLVLPGVPAGVAAHEETGRLFLPIPDADAVAMVETRGAALAQKLLRLPGLAPVQAFGAGALAFCHG
ncbi:MAG: hypothetical protein AAFY59_10535 [Pseudomonadota bacterium]